MASGPASEAGRRVAPSGTAPPLVSSVLSPRQALVRLGPLPLALSHDSTAGLGQWSRTPPVPTPCGSVWIVTPSGGSCRVAPASGPARSGDLTRANMHPCTPLVKFWKVLETLILRVSSTYGLREASPTVGAGINSEPNPLKPLLY